jgi:hypothetical protein
LIGAPVAAAADEALVDPVVAPVDDPAVVALAAAVVLVVAGLLLDEHAAATRPIVRTHAPYERCLFVSNFLPLVW